MWMLLKPYVSQHVIKIEDTKVNHRSSRAMLIKIRSYVRWESCITCILLETLVTAEPEQRNVSQYVNCCEEKEIALHKRHKKYFEEVQKLTSKIWCRTRQNNSLNFIRDMKLLCQDIQRITNLLVHVMDVLHFYLGKNTDASFALIQIFARVVI